MASLKGSQNQFYINAEFVIELKPVETANEIVDSNNWIREELRRICMNAIRHGEWFGPGDQLLRLRANNSFSNWLLTAMPALRFRNSDFRNINAYQLLPILESELDAIRQNVYLVDELKACRNLLNPKRNSVLKLSAKEKSIELISQLSDDVSFDDIISELRDVAENEGNDDI